MDIELATEGEYWMIMRGFLLLNRYASTGQAQRAGGFGSYNRRSEDGDIKENNDATTKLGFAEVLPAEKAITLMETITNRLLGKEAETDQKYVPYNGVPPPSDYFLGFSSPGTQVS